MEELNGKKYYLDGILKKNLDRTKENIKDDWDYLFIIDGEVGSGKSVFAQTLAWHCSDGKLNIDSICFTPEDFRNAIDKAPRYGAVVFDEAFRGLSARASLSETNKILVSMLNEIRQKNLFVFIVLPSVWDVDGYVSKHRTKGVFHVYVNKQRERGYFSFYSSGAMRLFMSDNKNRYRYPKEPAFHGRFRQPKPRYLVGEEEYLKKKQKALGDYVYKDDKGKKTTKRDIALTYALRKLRDDGYKVTEIGKMVGLSRKTVSGWLNGLENGENVTVRGDFESL